MTREMADYAARFDIGVEGELGAIAGVEDHIEVADEDAYLADVKQSEEFVQKTKVSAFAPAVGTAHGQYKGEPKLDFDRFSEIRDVCAGVPLVVHGGTGLSKSSFRRFIELGAAKINISTALKQAYMKAIRTYAAENAKNAPLEFDRFVIDHVRKTVKEHIEIFNSGGRA
jgi:fructose-bisphosphate aldolase class II